MVHRKDKLWQECMIKLNNEEEEGKGRSAKCPHERLKFQIFPTVVALLSLEQWRNAHGANGPDARRVSNFFNGHEKLVIVLDAWETLWSSSANRKR